MRDYTRLDAFCRDNGIRCEKDVPLYDWCTFKVGGPVDRFLEPRGEEDIEGILHIAGKDGLPLLVLGKGSNILFPDEGFRGTILHIGQPISKMELVGETSIRCGSGAPLSQLCLFAWERGLTGLEFAYGIPGTVGGAIYMNAGAYGGEIKDVLVSASHIGPRSGAGTFSGVELELSYRRSAYCGADKVITGGMFRLQKGDKAVIRAKMDGFMDRRRSKQPLEYPSAGSTFKRPDGAYASALIDGCGLKGRRVGGAAVSEKHAGFIINTGGATGADIRELIAVIQQEVFDKTGFRLECEVKIIG